MNLLLLLTVFLISCCAHQVMAPPPKGPPPTPTLPLQVSTSEGIVAGFKSNGARLFLGIPYAAPPVGSLRWSDPIPPTDRGKTIYDASYSGKQISCYSTLVEKSAFSGQPLPQSEDCLYLNIFSPVAPSKSLPSGYPVLIWIHGGGFQFGSGYQYDGTTYAKSGVVFVAINYRLNVFGFLYTSQLEGNYGLKDQIQAMKWVQQNIASFGGDPARVTIAGESSGAVSVSSHLINPLTQGLFQRAILDSNIIGQDPLEFQSTATALSFSTTLGSIIGCTDANTLTACLRTVTGQQLLQVVLAGIPFPGPYAFWAALRATATGSPTYGTSFMPIDPLTALSGNGYLGNSAVSFVSPA